MHTNLQLKLLENYRDRCYIMAILLQEHSDYYSFLNNCFNLPLIFSTSIMTVLNSSSFDANDMKIPNIVLNASTSLILSLMGNFKFVDRINNFNSISKKMTTLCHLIEDKVINRDIEEITVEDVRHLIKEYDQLNESVQYPYLNKIKDRIRKKFYEKKSLPNILNCTTELVSNSPALHSNRKRLSVSILGDSEKNIMNSSPIMRNTNYKYNGVIRNKSDVSSIANDIDNNDNVDITNIAVITAV